MTFDRMIFDRIIFDRIIFDRIIFDRIIFDRMACRGAAILRAGRAVLACGLLVVAGGAALAQSGRDWEDPPPVPPKAAPPAPAPTAPAPQPSPMPVPSRPPAPPAPPRAEAPPPRPAEPAAPAAPVAREAAPTPQQPAAAPRPPLPRPSEEAAAPESDRNLAGAARRFAAGYLDFWSRNNSVTPETVSDFYRPMVRFYGRLVPIDAIVDEKRRFIARWPLRDYQALPNSMSVDCNPSGELCEVATEFSFSAADPRRGRRTEGLGALELTVSFAEGRPLIARESSRVIRQGRGAASAMEE